MKPSLPQRFGFTLIETMVAITVLSLAISGPLLTANRAVIVAYTARDQLIAAYLSQEAIEYVRAMRDRVYLTDYKHSNVDNTWSDFTTNSGITGTIYNCIGKTCTLDPVSPTVDAALAVCPLNNCSATPLYITSVGVYTQQTGGGAYKKTLFTRSVTFTDLPPSQMRVSSKVQWSSHGQTYSVTATDVLSAWEI